MDVILTVSNTPIELEVGTANPVELVLGDAQAIELLISSAAGATGLAGEPGEPGAPGSDATVNAANVAAVLHAAALKDTPVDADEFPSIDTENGNVLKKWTGANIKAWLYAYFSGLFASTAQGNLADTAVQPGDLPTFGDIVTHNTSEFDAAGAAATAQSNAESYADGLAPDYDPAGAAATAEANANSYTDGQITAITPGSIGAEVAGAAATAEGNAEAYADGLIAALTPGSIGAEVAGVCLPLDGSAPMTGTLDMNGNPIDMGGTGFMNVSSMSDPTNVASISIGNRQLIAPNGTDIALDWSSGKAVGDGTGLTGLEIAANKSTSVTTDQGSNTKYPSVKSVYDWATGIFMLAANFTAANIKSLLGITVLSGNNTGDQTITLTGDATGSGTGSFAVTFATVNSNVGSFGSATKSVTTTVNGKGLVTAISEQTVTPAIGSVTGLGTGVGTFLATPSSANLAAALTDETGSGAAVFANSPTIDAPTISGAASFSSTTRPTSAGTGVPAATSLITRDDALLLPYYTRRLFNSCVGTASGTGATARRGQGSGIVDGDISTTPTSGAYFKITILSAGGALMGNASSCANLSARWMMMVRFSCYLGTNTHIMLCLGADCASGVPSSGVNIGMEITSSTSVRLWRCNSGAANYSSAGTISNASASTATHDQFFWLECDGAGNLNLYYANKAFASAMPSRPASAICALSGLASGFTDGTLPAMWLRAQSTSLSVAPFLGLRDCTFTEF